jgi:uncharacterized protein with von Willebrand factor type A (vWA) domain
MAERTAATSVRFEPAALAVGLAATLHRAGMAITPMQAARFADALPLVMPCRRDQLYWTARIALVSEHAQLPLFDAVFGAVFDGMLDPASNRGDTAGPAPVGSEPLPLPLPRPADARHRVVSGDTGPSGSSSAGPAPRERRGDRAPEQSVVPVLASSEERLRETAFSDMSSDEVAEMRRLVRRIVLATPSRRIRRTRSSQRSGERIDLRRTLRRARRTGGEPVRLAHRRRRQQPRRLVLLCDVSGSMEPYTRVFLSLLQGAVSGARAEAFVFATRLTRLTRQLAVRDPDRALAEAAVAAPDWAGGTRLAEGLRRFIDTEGRRGLARGSIVVILSDGWEQGDPQHLATQMGRLQRLTHRIVWVNPRKAARNYAPATGGMAAALPFCDAFVSGHTLAALEAVAAAIATGGPREPRNRRDL